MNDSPVEPSSSPARPTSPASFGSVAAKGSAINTIQWFVNKAITALAMLLLARFLVPEDYGVANQALAITQFLVIFFPLTMGDVLISHPREFESLMPTARRLALLIGVGTCAMILLGIPLFVRIYDTYPPRWLAGLIAIASLRPILDALLMVPLARMRIELQYRRIALIDGAIQFVATLTSLLLGLLGTRSASLVAPQVFGTGLRAWWYRRFTPSAGSSRFSWSVARMLMRAYLPAASAQYLHNVLVMLEVLVLGYIAGDYETGLFAFAFQVAAQANTVVAYQLGVVLQPIFGHLREDPVRQVAGFLRVQRVLGLVCVPISMAQALLAEPLFRIAFPAKYLPAVPIFQVISLAQAFYFATGPSMSCLRSQRRFMTFLIWQGTQLAVSFPLYWAGARWSDALGVSLASAGVWASSAPLVVWLCARVAPGRHAAAVAMVFIKPWLIATPVFLAAYLGVQWLAGFGKVGDLVALLTLGPLSALVAICISRFFDNEMRVLSDRVIAMMRAKWNLRRD